MVAPKLLPLKVGAQVMLVKVRSLLLRYTRRLTRSGHLLRQNVIQGLLVNGSLGRVVGFYKPREAAAMGAQIALPELAQPAKNSDADTQGGGEDGVRAAEMEKAQREQRDQKLKKIMATNEVWPAVQFVSGPLMLCVPLLFEVNNADGGIEAVREQVPLILAWALSIHKSQGQTLERVRVDLGRIFEKGQGKYWPHFSPRAYVTNPSFRSIRRIVQGDPLGNTAGPELRPRQVRSTCLSATD